MVPTADSTELGQGVPLLWLPLQQLPKAIRYLGMPSLPSVSDTSLVTTERTRAKRHSYERSTCTPAMKIRCRLIHPPQELTFMEGDPGPPLRITCLDGSLANP